MLNLGASKRYFLRRDITGLDKRHPRVLTHLTLYLLGGREA